MGRGQSMRHILPIVCGLSLALFGCGGTAPVDGSAAEEASAEVATEPSDATEEAVSSAQGQWIEGKFVEGSPAGQHFTIVSVTAQATTETDPAKLVIRGTMQNDTTLEASPIDLPRLTMDGSEVPCTYYLKGSQIDKIPGSTAEAPCLIDFEAVCDFDMSTHVWEFVPVDGTEVEGLEKAEEIGEYIADFAV